MAKIVRARLINVFLIALSVRIIYAIAAPALYVNVDTEGYYGVGMAMFAHPSVRSFITPYRTPVYPLFLNAVMYIAGTGGAPLGSPAFVWGAQIIVAIQMVIGALAFTALYHVLARVLRGRALHLFAVLLLCDVFVIGWEHTLMTEGLAISISLAITTVLFHILLKPSGKNFMLLWVLFAIGFLLRPSFIVYPVATLPILTWYFRKHARVVFFSCVTVAAAMLLPLVYARINYATVTYYGIQFVGDINVFGKILEYNIPVKSAKSYSYFYTTVSDYRTRNGANLTGFQFLWHYDPAIWGKVYRFVEMQGFNRTVILHNLPLYIKKSVATIPEILLEVCDFTLVSPATANLLTRIVWVLQHVYGYAQYATLAVPVLWIVMSIVFVLKPTLWHAITALVGTIAMSQIILTALVVYKDIGGQYGRVISVVRPHLFLFLFLFGVTILHAYQKKRYKI